MQPSFIGIETAVTDYIYEEAMANSALRDRFLPFLKPEAPPRKGENIMVPAEHFDDKLLAFAEQEGLIAKGADKPARAASIRDQIFGKPRTIQAGGALANSFYLMQNAAIDGKPPLGDGMFLTAVGDDEAGHVFTQSLAGHITHPARAGRTMTAHIIPIDGDRIIIASPSIEDSCDRQFNQAITRLDAMDFSQAKQVMLGGYLYYTGLYTAILDKVLEKTAALSDDPRQRPTIVLTAGAQRVAESEEMQAAFERARHVAPVVVAANTGEFRRLMQMDAEWRKPFAARFAGLEGKALEDAKNADDEYQQAKLEANNAAYDFAFAQYCDGKVPPVKFVVTNGGKSVYVVGPQGVSDNYKPPAPPRKIVNTVGGGDGFAGAFLFGEMMGLPQKQQVDLACLAAGEVICQDEARLTTITIDGRSGLLAYLDPANDEHKAILQHIEAVASKGLETEHKFLVKNDSWKAIAPTAVHHITQYYLPKSESRDMLVWLEPEDHTIMVAMPGQTVSLPIPADVLQKFGVENLANLTDELGNIILDDHMEARVRNSDGAFVFTIKAKTEDVASRRELEFPIDEAAAQAIIAHCPRSVEKIRHVLNIEGNKWEVDVFQGRNRGLVTAEIEAKALPPSLPDWLGENVTGEKRYSNEQLATVPYQLWARGERVR